MQVEICFVDLEKAFYDLLDLSSVERSHKNIEAETVLDTVQLEKHRDIV